MKCWVCIRLQLTKNQVFSLKLHEIQKTFRAAEAVGRSTAGVSLDTRAQDLLPLKLREATGNMMHQSLSENVSWSRCTATTENVYRVARSSAELILKFLCNFICGGISFPFKFSLNLYWYSYRYLNQVHTWKYESCAQIFRDFQRIKKRNVHGCSEGLDAFRFCVSKFGCEFSREIFVRAKKPR